MQHALTRDFPAARRTVAAAAALAAMAFAGYLQPASAAEAASRAKVAAAQANADESIRPFHVHVQIGRAHV